MRNYLRVYWKLIILNCKVVLEYRANFFFGAINTIAWGALNVVQVQILTNGTRSIYGWSRDEIVLLTVVFNILIGFFHFFFSRNFLRFSELIHFGQLDSILSKPLDSQFLITMWHIRFPNLLRSIFLGIYGFFLLKSLNYEMSVWTVILFFLLLGLGLVLMYSIWMLIATLIIWHTRLTNLIDLLFFMNHISRYPREMYMSVGSHILLTILPFTFIVIPSTRVLIGNLFMGDVLGLIAFAVVLFALSRAFWNFALRSYTSANG